MSASHNQNVTRDDKSVLLSNKSSLEYSVSFGYDYIIDASFLE
jgi:hypothetical protein